MIPVLHTVERFGISDILAGKWPNPDSCGREVEASGATVEASFLYWAFLSFLEMDLAPLTMTRFQKIICLSDLELRECTYPSILYHELVYEFGAVLLSEGVKCARAQATKHPY